MELFCHKGAVSGIACLHMHRGTAGHQRGLSPIRETWNEPSSSRKRAGTSGQGLQCQGISERCFNHREEPQFFSLLPAMQSSLSFLKPPILFQSSQSFPNVILALKLLSLPRTFPSLPSTFLPSPPSLHLQQHPCLVCILLENL